MVCVKYFVILAIFIVGASAQNKTSFDQLLAAQGIAFSTLLSTIETINANLGSGITNARTQAASLTKAPKDALTAMANTLERFQASLAMLGNASTDLSTYAPTVLKAINDNYATAANESTSALETNLIQFTNFLKNSSMDLISLTKLQVLIANIQTIVDAINKKNLMKTDEAAVLVNDITKAIDSVDMNVTSVADIFKGYLEVLKTSVESLTGDDFMQVVAFGYDVTLDPFVDFSKTLNKLASTDIPKIVEDFKNYIRLYVDPLNVVPATNQTKPITNTIQIINDLIKITNNISSSVTDVLSNLGKNGTSIISGTLAAGSNKTSTIITNILKGLTDNASISSVISGLTKAMQGIVSG